MQGVRFARVIMNKAHWAQPAELAMAAYAMLLTMTAFANAATVISDAATLIVDSTIFQLDGVDAPQTDQVCVDAASAKWWCGIEARDKLREWVGNRAVRCDDKGRDRIFKSRRLGVCRVGDEKASLNQWLV